jgi:thiamine pyrophosphokinase
MTLYVVASNIVQARTLGDLDSIRPEVLAFYRDAGRAWPPVP